MNVDDFRMSPYVVTFGLTQDEYDRYRQWCHEINADGYTGAIGGGTTFHISPTSVGELITVTCRRVKRDANGNPIEKRHGKDGKRRFKMKTLRLVLREL